MPEGKRQILSFHIPGDMYDAQSFLLDTMDHCVGTITPARVAVISHSKILELTENFPRIARAIWKETLVNAAIFRQWIASVGRRSAYQRIAHLMCELYVKNQAVARVADNQIEWPITQGEMADALGLSLVHVNRTLQELRSADLIRLKAGTLAVLDWEGLKHAGQFDPCYLHLKPREPAHAGNGHPPGPTG
jgi:CRP-like cAMP-binding protein